MRGPLRNQAAAVLLLLLTGGLAAAATAAPPSSPPRLEERLADASVVARGRVSRVASHDHDRVRVIHFAVDRVLKGEERLGATQSLEIVEMRDRPTAAPLLEGGDQAVVFLRRMSRTSYLDTTLGSGRRWQASGGRDGVLAARDAVAADQAADLMERLAMRSRAPAPTPEERAAARRAWTFDALGATHEALVEEGARGLPEIEGVASDLAAAEKTRLSQALRRDDVSPRVRAVLYAEVAEAKLRSLAPTLATLREEDALALDALWSARAALGDPPRAASVAQRLQDPEASVRATAARAYARMFPNDAPALVGRVAREDAEKDVRIAALEALGPLASDDATKVIEIAFVEDGELAVRQAAGRVLFERGGDRAAESLGRLAFDAAPEGQRHAVALLMALGRPDDPIVARIRETHPDEKTREMVEHGFQDSHAH